MTGRRRGLRHWLWKRRQERARLRRERERREAWEAQHPLPPEALDDRIDQNGDDSGDEDLRTFRGVAAT